MKCNKCKLVEMKVEKIEENKMKMKCKKCGTIETIEIPKEEKTVNENQL